MILLTIVSGIVYLSVIGSFYYGWIRLRPFKSSENHHNVFVSVIIPVRNEKNNLETLIKSLYNQNYNPHCTEIIIVDDHSIDGSSEIAASLLKRTDKVIALQSNKAGKKAALQEGILSAKGDLLVTTDADCIYHPEWLQTIVNIYVTKKPALILAPVIGSEPINLFESLQQLEILSLLGSTAGAASIHHAIMCNGANLAFPRTIIKEILSGYTNEEVASGDDMFVLEKVKKQYPQGIYFAKSKEATVSTRLAGNLIQFFNQRRRWTTKAKFYTDKDIIFTGLAVLQINILLLFFLVFAFVSSNYTFFLLLLGIKTIVDLPFLWAVSRFFKKGELMYCFPVLQCVYFFYVSFTFLGSFTGNFNWKSRKLSA
ncbi:MAG TPA: glycosyltransferase [Bacteroidales bacterium]|nr:glycosyltransferase [Bacteroidales bacterium]